ncbi:MAG: DUF2007 domain-containing protein [Thermoanaerobaculia bacterium]|nr:DUF2007 domain-containing protein [Thermoanaerobaculia bacterium]
MKEPPRFVTIRHYFDPFEAQLTCATLEAAGIDVLTQNGHFVSTVWTEAIAVGGVQVLVPEEAVAEAEAILGQTTRVVAEDAPDEPAPDLPAPPAASPASLAADANARADRDRRGIEE